MTSPPGLDARITALATAHSPYPPSFDNSGWLYGFALGSLLCIAMFGASTSCWMSRDSWRYRHIDGWGSPAFQFRLMIGIAAATAFVRSLPEVVYMTQFGEVTGATIAQILAVKRWADIIAMPMAVAWMAILVVSYDRIIVGLRTVRAQAIAVDSRGPLRRLARPIAIFIVVVLIAAMVAVGKGAMGHP
ncbi:hypothetical protein [Novosphingobium sp. 9]|uniref:hypothetical protein n=1 Tax=Novosphingobium sp. 9 TaxID=2025349 RepID=UPI0021B60CCB|nr:hypothetical protein [Novosphingobium sp. 9]